MRYTIEEKQGQDFYRVLSKEYIDRVVQERFAGELTKAILEKTHVQKTDEGFEVRMKAEVIVISSVQFDDIMENLRKLMEMAKGNYHAENRIKDIRNILLK